MTSLKLQSRIARSLLGGVVLATVFALGCRPPADHSDRARRSNSTAKATEVKSSAEPRKATPTPVAPPAIPSSPKPAIQDVVRSALPHMTIPEADDDAIEQARLRLVEKLTALKPAIRQMPPLSAVREQYVRKDSRVVRKPNEIEQAVIDQAGLEPNQIYVEYTLEVSDSQLRQLRMHDRLVDALRVVGGLFVVALAGFLFLRADDWSRGYLTSWLGLFAGLLVVAGLVAVLTIAV